MNKRYTVLLFILFLGLNNTSFAQVDPHFSQYYAYPVWLNPALTGAIDGNFRATAIYRNQWGNIASPYSTAGVALDMNTAKEISFGVNILQQTAGDGGYKYQNVYASVAYSGVKFGSQNQHHVLFGLQVGFLNRSFNPSKFRMGDQWTPITGYNPGVGSSDIFPSNRASSFDAGAGITYYNDRPEQKVNVFGGFSAYHLTKPTDNFAAAGAKDDKLPLRFNVHAGARIVVSDVLELTPHAIYVRQGNAEEKMAGVYGQLYVNEQTDVLLGANYRIEDAVSPYVGFKYNRFQLGASYDISTSELASMAKGSNSFEVSLTIIGARNTKNQYFKCPRL